MSAFLEDTLNRKIVFFTGKGGVGKTSVCLATAIAAQRAGKRVIVRGFARLGVNNAGLPAFDVPAELHVHHAPRVEIGQPVPTPAGSPITANTDPPAMTDRPITVDHLLDIPAALELAPGTTAWIDGSVYALVDGATICAEPGSLTHTTQPPLTTAPAPIGCPAGAPIAAGITGTAGYYKYYGGPLLATRTDTGFERVASTGGYGGSTLPG